MSTERRNGWSARGRLIYDWWRRRRQERNACGERSGGRGSAAPDYRLTRRNQTGVGVAVAVGKRVSRCGPGRVEGVASQRLDRRAAVPPRRPTGIGPLTSRRSDRRRGASRRENRWDFGPPTTYRQHFTIIIIIVRRCNITHTRTARLSRGTIDYFFSSYDVAAEVAGAR